MVIAETMRSALRALAPAALMVLSAAALATVTWAQDVADAETLARQASEEAFERYVAEGRTAADVPRRRAGLPALSAKMAGFTCVPTCTETDAKFLALAGTGRFTLSDQALNLEIAVPAGTTSFQVGFFDGDGSRPTTTGTTRWDSGPQSVFRYTLFADPQADGTGLVVVPMGGLPFQLSTSMADAAWSDFTVDVLPVADPAQAPSGNLFYRLRIEVDGFFNPSTLNVFKVRSTGLVSIRFGQQPFSYIGNFGTDFQDIVTVYPNFPSLTPTTYDGTFSFFFDTPAPQETIEVFDGDFDFGTADGITDRDTDDPNTPNTVPDFAPPGSTAVPEGVAVGLGLSTGNPPDDGAIEAFRRSPSVVFDVITPNLEIFTEDNPSGNLEWERFVVSTSSAGLPDAVAASLPAGAYEYRVRGVDLLNLNAIRLPFRLLCVDPLGDVCTPLRPFLLGDSVFTDVDEDGIQDAGEPGIPDVIVNLEDGLGNFIATAATDANGGYSFEVDAGDYVVEIDAANFAPGGALEGRTSTTGGETSSGTVTDDNVLTFDFGYSAPGGGTIGDRVWNDFDGDGVQDAGEPGLEGVTVTLFDAGGIALASQITGIDGRYSFDDLDAGTYTVVVDESTLPAGLAQTFDFDGLVSRSRTTVSLAGGETNLEVDFGYAACGACEGKVTELTLQYTGAQPAQVEVRAKRGPTLDVVFSGTLQPGETFTIVGPQSGNGGFFGTLGTEIRIFVNGSQQTKIHTSCSVPIGPGLRSGDFLVVSGRSRHGGLLCPLTAPDDPTPPAPPAACGCEGKVTELTLRYEGSSVAAVEIEAKRGPTTDTVFSGSLGPGQVFTITGPATGNGGFAGTLGTEVRLYVGGKKRGTMHTSCSQPIGPGLRSGDFLVLEGFSAAGSALCPIP